MKCIKEVILSVYTFPLTKDTDGMINKDSIAKMKDGVMLINTSRGQLIVEQDLVNAVNNTKVYAAALDVVATEPIKPDNILLGVNNIVITPHIAWATIESRKRLFNTTIANIKNFQSNTPINIVN